jgi:hypothetical protein
MQIAILIAASGAFVCSATTLVIMANVALQMKEAKEQVEAEVADLKQKVNKNASIVQGALRNLDLEL